MDDIHRTSEDVMLRTLWGCFGIACGFVVAIVIFVGWVIYVCKEILF